MLRATRALTLLDAFRVPYVVESDGRSPLERLERADGAGPRLVWPARPSGGLSRLTLQGTPFFAALLPDDRLTAALRATGGEWRPTRPVEDAGGVARARIHEAADGSVALPFDPDEALDAFLSERYVALDRVAGSGALGVARGAYYRVRPLLPRPLQLALRRRFARVQERAAFPSWPVEPALHRLQAQLLALVEQVAGEPLPWLAPWPAGRSWAAVLTHDVERAPGYAHVRAVAAVERRHGLRSAWYFVPERDYEVADDLLADLRAQGHEVGVHGLRHDGRDLAAGHFEERLPAIRSYAARWGAVGFRSPATHRDPLLLPRLAFDYDSSYSDVARYEPQPGGSCSWLPFGIGDLVELPITLPMDHTLFELLGSADAQLWWEKASYLRDRGGMALLLTHPDYLLRPERLRVYERFVEWVAGQPGAWHALPAEVSAWWRRRGASAPVRAGSAWRVEGPARDDAQLRVGAPAPPPRPPSG